MTNITIFGDTHLDGTAHYLSLAAEQDYSLHVGDLCLGYPGEQAFENEVELRRLDPERHRVLRGNHDNPANFRTLPQHRGSGPFLWPDGRRAFAVNGAYTMNPDRYRTGMNHWFDEEHTHAEVRLLFDEFQRWKPDIIVSHDGPPAATLRMFLSAGERLYYTTTTMLLNNMFLHATDNHWEAEWYFGHWHETAQLQVAGLTMTCVGRNQSITVPLALGDTLAPSPLVDSHGS